jgi:hypothetical protein
LSQLGIHHYERIAGLVYLEALNDGTDDYTDYDAVSSKLPEVMRTPPTPSPTVLKSFQTYRDWRSRIDGISIPGAELRNEFAENPDGTVGSYKISGNVPKSIMEGDHKHDYSQIRVPVLALVGFPEFPQDQIEKNYVMDQQTGLLLKLYSELTWA